MTPPFKTSALLAAWAFSAHAAGPSAAESAALNRRLNPTATPNVYGLESHIHTNDPNIDAHGDRIFDPPTPEQGQKRHPSAARVKPCASFLPLWTDLHAFEGQLDAYEHGAVISRARASAFRERLALLRIQYGLARKPDGSGLTREQRQKMSLTLAGMRKELLP